jgi:hypothetical protein
VDLAKQKTNKSMEQIRDARKQTHNKYSQPIFDKAKATQ